MVMRCCLRWLTPVVLAVVMCANATGAFAQKRVALVIGNNAYTRIDPLNNAINDAAAIAEELNKNGFQVIRVFDVKRQDLQEAKRRFITSVANGGIGVFFFAGHGLQVEGRNFLLPVDFAATTASGFARESLSVPAFLDELESANPKLSILILDACRDNPFSTTEARVATRGLSEIARPIPTGTLVLYAASANQTALDAIPPSKNGLFTGEFLAAMRNVDLEIRELAQRVRYSVMEKAQVAGHLQVPALYDNLSPGSFYLSKLGQAKVWPAGGTQQLPRQIKLIVPFAANSPSDGVVRTIVPFLSKALSREVVLENDIDVQGDKVAQRLVASPRDGSVLLISNFATSARRLQSADSRLAPIGIVADMPLSIVVNNQLRARSLPDLLTKTKSQRRRLRMAVPLKGSPAEMCGQQVQAKFGGNIIELISFPGEGPAVAAVIGGQADLTCAATAPVRSMASQPNAKIQELAEIRTTSSPLAKRVQIDAAGQQGFDIIAPNWIGLFGPAGLSADLTSQLSSAIATIQSDPDFVQAISRLQAQPVSADQSSPAGLIRSLRLSLSLQR